MPKKMQNSLLASSSISGVSLPFQNPSEWEVSPLVCILVHPLQSKKSFRTWIIFLFVLVWFCSVVFSAHIFRYSFTWTETSGDRKRPSNLVLPCGTNIAINLRWATQRKSERKKGLGRHTTGDKLSPPLRSYQWEPFPSTSCPPRSEERWPQTNWSSRRAEHMGRADGREFNSPHTVPYAAEVRKYMYLL